MKTIVATFVLIATGSIFTTAVAADAPAAADSSKLKTALTPLAQLLQLMDTDKNGKVSKEERPTIIHWASKIRAWPTS
jgi:hypothetical protein